MKREFAVLGIIIALGVGLLGGWFIPSPITTPRTPLIDEIKSRGELIVGTSADYPPFENFSYPYTGAIEGFDVDVSQLIADYLGVNLKVVNLEFASLISACQADTIDMIAAAMTYNEERAKSIAASITYINVSEVVIVKQTSPLTTLSSLDELGGLTVGCQTGTVMQDELTAVGNITVDASPSAVILMTKLSSEAIAAAYVDEPVFAIYNKTENLRIIYSSGVEHLALWTRYGEPELLYVMNNVLLSAFLDGTMSGLYSKWGFPN